MRTTSVLFLFLLTNPLFAQNSGLFSYLNPNVQGCNSYAYANTPLVATKIKKGQTFFHSNDGGTTWQDLGAGLPEGIEVSRCYVNNGITYIGSFDGKIYANSDVQKGSWELQEFEGKTSKGFITGIITGKKGNYACTYQDGFYRQPPGTHIWKSMHGNLVEKEIFAVLELEDGSIVVGGSNGIYITQNEGMTWKHVFEDSWVNSLTRKACIILTSGSKGLYRCDDNGKTWNCVVTETGGVHKTIVIDDYFVIIHGGGNRVSISNDGLIWKPMDPGKPSDLTIYDINQSGEYLFSSRKAGISRSKDFGKTWELVLSTPNEFEKENMYCEIVVSETDLFAIVRKGC